MIVVWVTLGTVVGTCVGVLLGFAVLGAIVRAADDLRARETLLNADQGATHYDYAADDPFSMRGRWN